MTASQDGYYSECPKKILKRQMEMIPDSNTFYKLMPHEFVPRSPSIKLINPSVQALSTKLLLEGNVFQKLRRATLPLTHTYTARSIDSDSALDFHLVRMP